MIDSARPLTLAEVAQRYQVTVRTVQGWVIKGKFPEPIRVGRVARWPLNQLIAWEAQQAGMELPAMTRS